MGIHLKWLVQYRSHKHKHLKAAGVISHLTRPVIHGWEESRDVHHRIITPSSEGEENPPFISEVSISSPFAFYARLWQLRVLMFRHPFAPLTVSHSSWASLRVACWSVGALLTYCDQVWQWSTAHLSVWRPAYGSESSRRANKPCNQMRPHPIPPSMRPPNSRGWNISKLWTRNPLGMARHNK